MAKPKKHFVPIEQCMAYAREIKEKNGVNSQRKWVSFHRKNGRPEGIPSDPYRIYKALGTWPEGGYGEFFGTYIVCSQPRKYRSYEQFVAYCKENNVKRGEDFIAISNKPLDIHSSPALIYPNFSWYKVLGYGQYCDYETARELVLDKGYASKDDYRIAGRKQTRPKELPQRPDKVYKEHWVSWEAFLSPLPDTSSD